MKEQFEKLENLIENGIISTVNITADQDKKESHGIIPYFHVVLSGRAYSGIGWSNDSLEEAIDNAIDNVNKK